MKRLLPLLGWLATAPALFAAGVEFEARIWSPDLAGVGQIGNGGAATAIDFVSDLGLADENVPEGRLIWRPTRRTSVRLSYANLDFSGDAQLERTVTFSGTTFELDARVASLLELEYGRIGIAWQPLATGDGRFRIGPLVEANGLRGDAALSTNILGLLPVSASENFELAFASAGVLLDFEPSRKLNIYAEWTAAVETDEGDLTDAEAGVRYYPLEMLAVTVGYRRLEIDFIDANNLLDLQLDGPFFGGVLRF